MYLKMSEFDAVHSYFAAKGAGEVYRQGHSGVWRFFFWGHNMIVANYVSDNTIELVCGLGDKNKVGKELEFLQAVMAAEEYGAIDDERPGEE